MKPYIGITDFTSMDNVQAMLNIFVDVFHSKKPRDLMIGTMMSYKTLNGLVSKWSRVFPRQEDFYNIYPTRQEPLLNTLHYADYDGVTEIGDLATAIMIANHRGPFSPGAIDALQLDMIWPSTHLIKEAVLLANSLMSESTKIDGDLENLKIILQIGRKATEQLDNSPQKVASRIKQYAGAIHCVLFDMSGGLGKEMNPQLLLSYLTETKNICPDISLAVAGGLGPNTMDIILPILEEFPGISIDAQGKLRPSGNALDPIDWNLAGKYITEASKVLT